MRFNQHYFKRYCTLAIVFDLIESYCGQHSDSASPAVTRVGLAVPTSEIMAVWRDLRAFGFPQISPSGSILNNQVWVKRHDNPTHRHFEALKQVFMSVICQMCVSVRV